MFFISFHNRQDTHRNNHQCRTCNSSGIFVLTRKSRQLFTNGSTDDTSTSKNTPRLFLIAFQTSFMLSRKESCSTLHDQIVRTVQSKNLSSDNKSYPVTKFRRILHIVGCQLVGVGFISHLLLFLQGAGQTIFESYPYRPVDVPPLLLLAVCVPAIRFLPNPSS